MFRANIYSLEPLAGEAREAVNDGIGMVAAYMGQVVTTRELKVRLPQDGRGNVNFSRVGYGKLDKLVELHLMAVPLDAGTVEALGIAYLGMGVGYVDVKRKSPDLMFTTTAHEVAHAFGFVLPNAKQVDSNSSSHCCDSSCIMHKHAIYETQYEPNLPNSVQKWKHILGMKSAPYKSTIYRPTGQHDFCLPCKLDLHNKGDEKLSDLRVGRLFGVGSKYFRPVT